MYTGIFPLEFVVFPGEALHLHIFEQRYIKLINNCLENEVPFGLTPFLEQAVAPFGTLVWVKELAQEYDDGRMDIRCRAGERFAVGRFVEAKSTDDYLAAEVEPRPTGPDRDFLNQELIALMAKWEKSLGLKLNHQGKADTLAWSVAKQLGLELEEQYGLLQMDLEEERQGYLLRYMQQGLPTLEKAQKIREIIALNGDFRVLEGRG